MLQLKLYLDHRIPNLKNGKKAAQDMAHLIPYITGRTLEDLGDIARQYCKDHPQLAAATLHNRLAYLKAAVRYAYKRHRLGDRDYTDQMMLPSVSNERQVFITPEDQARESEICDDPEAAALFTLAFYTGLRWRSEILTLKRESIVITQDQAWLNIPDTKSGRPHMVPVHPNAVDALQYIPFLRSDSYYYARYWKARKAAGLEHVRMHDKRHSLASAMLSTGTTLGEVGIALNHGSVQSTKRYAHLYNSRLLELILRLPVTKKDAPAFSKTPKTDGKNTA